MPNGREDYHRGQGVFFEESLIPETADSKRARRERIATAALQGILATHGPDNETSMESDVRAAVEYADLLIAELDKETEG